MNLTLREILSTIDTMVPNSLPYGLKIQWINHIQNQLYRDYPVPEAIYPFLTVPDEKIYELPSDCSEDGIKQVVVDGKTYDLFHKERIRIWSKRRFIRLCWAPCSFIHHLPYQRTPTYTTGRGLCS